MGLPSVTITFREKSATAMQRGSRGVVALVLEDTAAPGLHTLHDASQTPGTLTAVNQAYIRRAWMGYVEAPRKVYVYVIAGSETLENALAALEPLDADYLAIMPDATAAEATAVATWVKGMRDTRHSPIKAVLANHAGNHEGIINFAATGLKAGNDTFTAGEYCSRIAGMLAGTPIAISCTHALVPELTHADTMSREDMDDAIDGGQLILINDGGRIRIARGVNSYVPAEGAEKGAAFTKIKLVDLMDMITRDIRTTLEDTFIGKYANTYDNKCLMLSLIKGYLEGLEAEGVLERGKSEVAIDVDAVRGYLAGKQADVSAMTEAEVRMANTGDKVFLTAKVTLVDAVEDVILPIQM